MSSKIARLNDLFVEGVEVPLPNDTCLWINKLNPFEQNEARSVALAARSRTMLAIKDIGTDEYAVFQAEVAQATKVELVEMLTQNKGVEFITDAVGDLEADPDWAERLKVLRDSVDIPAEPGSAEAQYEEKLNLEYRDAIEALSTKHEAEFRAKVDLKTADELRAEFQDSWLDEQGMNSFTREYQQSQLYFAWRECAGVRDVDENGRWRHDDCDHSAYMLEDRGDAAKLSNGLIQAVLAGIQRLEVSGPDARFSVAPSTFSESSEQPSPAEVSTPSIPAEIPAEGV